ncbi:acetyl-CoA carboxylase biotin carboxyl carrier protein subunit [Actinomadura montaniterrae]|uniref:Biotin carboxyl carrier protein of acetyl-CoA carboxylase n=2 Tax=Actinomadura montaniterrae TaxID=1803903 RepID=A0A6L3W5F5_9ACTN|nr:acetyl-CoA carboxylase biotin carboxyl carrier protein subunit [Actinomadura montaniterrae]
MVDGGGDNGRLLTTELADAWLPVFDRGGETSPRQLLREAAAVVAELLALHDERPATFNVRIGDVSIELGWAPPQRPAPPAVPAAVPAALPAGVPVATPASAPGAEAPAEPEPAEEGDPVTAPTVGVFYRAPSPGAEPFVREGETVAAGQQLGIVEAMKLMIPVEADRAGTVARVLRADGDAVEYAEPLFLLAPVEVG